MRDGVFFGPGLSERRDGDAVYQGRQGTGSRLDHIRIHGIQHRSIDWRFMVILDSVAANDCILNMILGHESIDIPVIDRSLVILELLAALS